MGTSYYELEKPITYVDVRKLSESHSNVHIWVNHGKAGKLLVRNDEVVELLLALSSEKVIVHAHWGGKKAGVITQKMNDTEDLVVISEYGEVERVATLM